MRELSVFCDESGDFGPFESHAPHYLVSLVFHDQSSSISELIRRHEEGLALFGLPRNHAIHTAPLIRREQEYRHLDGAERKRLFDRLMTFMRLADIKTKTFVVEKRDFGEGDELADRIAREMGFFIRDHLSYFQSYDRVIVYYDRGQKEITRILRTVFSAYISNVEFRVVSPENYQLFQVADMVCTLELLAVKIEHEGLSRSEKTFFGGVNKLKKTYLKVLKSKRIA